MRRYLPHALFWAYFFVALMMMGRPAPLGLNHWQLAMVLILGAFIVGAGGTLIARPRRQKV
jgi:hypothetical protein